MKKIESPEDDDPDPSKCGLLSRSQERDLGIFEKEAKMLNQLKRIVVRRKLKKEKKELLYQLMDIKRKLKILDKLDEVDEVKEEKI